PVERDVTQDDVMLGSPRYMSPEQILCETVDARTDIYSLGAVLYALLAGRPPFVGRAPIDALTQHLQRPVPSFAELFESAERLPPYVIDPRLEALVMRC